MRCARSVFYDLDREGVALGNLRYNVKPFRDLAEACVVSVQMGSCLPAVHEEELRSTGVATCMRH